MKNQFFFFLVSIFILMTITLPASTANDPAKIIREKAIPTIHPRNLSQIFPINLVKKDFFARLGFNANEINQWPTEKPEKNKKWIFIPVNEKHQRILRPKDINFPNFQPPRLTVFDSQKSQIEMTLLTRFFLPESYQKTYKNISLLLSSIGDNYAIYLNGAKITNEIYLNSQGLIEKQRNRRNLLIPLDNRLLKSGENILAFHILGNYHYSNVGLFYGSPYKIDDTEELSYDISERLALILITLYLFVGLYHLLLFFRRPREKYNLYFGLFTTGLFIYLFSRSTLVFDFLSNSKTIMQIELIVLFIIPYFLVMFIDTLLLGSGKIFGKVYLIFSLLLSIPVLFVSDQFSEKILIIWQFTSPLIMMYLVYRLMRSLIRRIQREFSLIEESNRFVRSIKATSFVFFNDITGNILIGFFILMITASYDILDSLIWFSGIALTKYGFFIFIIGIAISLANQFLTVHARVEELNKSLEKKVEDRTKKLKESLFSVQKLKEQQDGDYFLTSLLTEPLIANQANNEKVLVEFYVKEKKEFQFRKWKREIGGDMCMAHSLVLRNKHYTFFINADAMGKSIQGAGGILVLGSVLKSQIERTLVSRTDNELFPERWLRNTFLELQKVFESFNGSMLISAVLGLVDDETGLMYFINAEHPWSILYRDHKARFIDDELTFHKIGTQGVNGQLWVKTFQLKQNDIVFLGSDGRDDILLGIDEKTGERIINEDETLILKMIEEAQGDIHDVAKLIQNYGELTDDLSLMRLQMEDNPQKNSAGLEAIFQELSSQNKLSETIKEDYNLLMKLEAMMEKGNFQDSLPQLETLHISYPMDLTILALLVKCSYRLKNIHKLLKYAELYYHIDPENSQYIYLAAYAAKKIKDYKSAADLGERFRLRDPYNIKNLINLADIYRLNGNNERALRMIKSALDIDSNNRSAQKLAESLGVIF